MLNVYIILCHDDGPILCDDVSMERDGKLGKRFSTHLRRSYTLNSIGESNACSLVDHGDDYFKGVLDNDEDLMDNDIL